jgi:hypothetical protein
VKNIIGVLVLFFGFQAHAGILLEPFVGYDMGANKTTDTSSVDQSSKFSGTGFGARLGFRFMNGVSLAAEYASSSGTIKDNSGQAAIQDSNYSRAATSAVLGYDRGIWRFYVGYGFSDALTEKANNVNTTVDSKLTGTSYKLGVGVMPIRHVAVNLEYCVPTYKTINSDTISASGLSTDLSAYYSTFATSVTSLVVSFPFDFAGK